MFSEALVLILTNSFVGYFVTNGWICYILARRGAITRPHRKSPDKMMNRALTKMLYFYRGVSTRTLAEYIPLYVQYVIIDVYVAIPDDSDLNLTISKDNLLSATPICDQGFMYMWAGARGTYGFNSGKVYYDVKVSWSS